MKSIVLNILLAKFFANSSDIFRARQSENKSARLHMLNALRRLERV